MGAVWPAASEFVTDCGLVGLRADPELCPLDPWWGHLLLHQHPLQANGTCSTPLPPSPVPKVFSSWREELCYSEPTLRSYSHLLLDGQLQMAKFSLCGRISRGKAEYCVTMLSQWAFI